MSIDFTPCMINTYHGDIYNRTTDTDNAKNTKTHRCGLVIIRKNSNPLIFHCLKKDITLNNLI